MPTAAIAAVIVARSFRESGTNGRRRPIRPLVTTSRTVAGTPEAKSERCGT